MEEEKKSNQVLKDFIVAFFVPTCINKMFMLYFFTNAIKNKQARMIAWATRLLSN
jgi:hypothetical protein